MQLHLAEFQSHLAAHDARIVVLSFAPLADLASWVPYFRDTFVAPHLPALQGTLFARTRFVADPGLATYHAYGLGRNSRLRVYGWRVLWPYIKWALAGRTIRRPRQDPLRRGGDFLVARDGRLALAHVGRDQADRPSLAALQAALQAA
ncbi:MAG: hypothetical protein EXR72_05580 [Myxococcales bacterium]|nr:hypothetical protein [Myxococcales bacterium]